VEAAVTAPFSDASGTVAFGQGRMKAVKNESQSHEFSDFLPEHNHGFNGTTLAA